MKSGFGRRVLKIVVLVAAIAVLAVSLTNCAQKKQPGQATATEQVPFKVKASARTTTEKGGNAWDYFLVEIDGKKIPCLVYRNNTLSCDWCGCSGLP